MKMHFKMGDTDWKPLRSAPVLNRSKLSFVNSFQKPAGFLQIPLYPLCSALNLIMATYVHCNIASPGRGFGAGSVWYGSLAGDQRGEWLHDIPLIVLPPLKVTALLKRPALHNSCPTSVLLTPSLPLLFSLGLARALCSYTWGPIASFGVAPPPPYAFVLNPPGQWTFLRLL